MKIILILLLSVLFYLPSTNVYSAEVRKVLKRKRVLISPQGETFKKGQIVEIIDSDGSAVAKVKVYKVKKKKKRIKVYGKILEGKPSKGDEVRTMADGGDGDGDGGGDGDSMAKQPSPIMSGEVRPGIVGYVGIASIGFSDLQPIVFGGDYVHPLMSGKLLVFGGADYWLASSGAIDVTMLTISGGAGYVVMNKPKYSVIAGGRLGQGTNTITLNTTQGSGDASISSLIFAPYGRGYYRLSSRFSVGGEFRYSYYLDDVFKELRGIYLLFTVKFDL